MAAKRRTRNQSTGMMRGSGSVDQLPSGAWRARYRGRSLGTRPTEEEAKALLEAERQHELYRPADTSALVPFSEYLEAAIERRDLAPRTQRLYASLVRTRIAGSELAGTPLAVIDQATVDAWWRGIEHDISAAKAWRLVSSVVREATDDRLINVPIRPPSKKAGREDSDERPLLRDGEVQAIIAAHEERYRIMPLIAAAAGFRYSEVAALQRHDLDSERSSISVTRAVKQDSPFLVGPPKSKASIRRVTVADAVMAACLEHASIYSGSKPDAWLVTSTSGRPPVRGNYTRVWHRALKQAGLDPYAIRFHDLRHWSLSNAARVMPAGALMRRSGHANPAVGARYAHLAESLDRTAGEALGRQLGL